MFCGKPASAEATRRPASRSARASSAVAARVTGRGLALAIAAMATRRSGPSLRLRNRPDRSGLAVEILRG